MDELLDLGFGKCRLQVQVPEKGEYTSPEQLIGKNVVTSFTGLAAEYFEKLEREQAKKGAAAGLLAAEDGAREEVVRGGTRSGSSMGRLKTKIKFVGGSVEAACALGVADGIVDLVGMLWFPPTTRHTMLHLMLIPVWLRIRRDHEGSRPEAHCHRPGDHRDPY